MLESFSSTAILTKVKAMAGRMLTDEDYEQLLNRDSVAACAAYLKNHPGYAPVLRDIQETQIHRGMLEALLQKTLFEQFTRLQRYAGRSNRFFRDSYAVKLDLQCIGARLHMFGEEEREAFIRSVPGYIFPYLSLDVRALGDACDFEALLRVLRRTPYYKVLEPLRPREGEPPPLPAAEHALYDYYYRYVTKLVAQQFHGSTKRELMQVFTAQAQLQDIQVIFRLKSFFGGNREQIERLLLDIEGPLPRRLMRALLDAPDGDAVIALLADSRCGRFFDEEHFLYIENSAGALRHDLAKRLLTFSRNPASVFAAFIALREIEIDNLMAIIEGARYQVPASEIRPMLIRGTA